MVFTTKKEGVAEWVNKMTAEGKLTNWNVVVARIADKKILKLPYGEIAKVGHSKKMITIKRH